jgi:hypothetical protein
VNNKKRNVWIGTVLLIIGLVGFMLFRPKPNDSAQITTALTSAVKASKEGRSGGVMEYLASNVQVNGEKYDVNRQFSEFIRQYHPDIALGAINPKINGDQATVTTDLDISLLNHDVRMQSVTFTLQKEHETTLLIFHSEEWKVTGASAPAEAYQQIISEMPSMGGLGSGVGLW